MPLDADLIFDLTDPAVIKVDLNANLRTVGKARVQAAVRVPVQLFDARAWRRLGVAAVDSASLRIEKLEIDELMAARFGLGTVRGIFTIDVNAASGLRELEAKVVASELLAGPLVEPAAVTIEVQADGRGTDRPRHHGAAGQDRARGRRLGVHRRAGRVRRGLIRRASRSAAR